MVTPRSVIQQSKNKNRAATRTNVKNVPVLMAASAGNPMDQFMAPEVQREIQFHKVIRMNGCKWLNHCFLRFFRIFCCTCCCKKGP
jgi:hypothetical protein